MLDRRLVRFFLVGCVGLLVDEAVLYLAIAELGVGPYFGRLLSVFVALVVVWRLNRRYTFDVSRHGIVKEFLAYLTTGSAGLGINLLVYTVMLHVLHNPYVALIFGTGAGFFFNYLVLSRMVYR